MPPSPRSSALGGHVAVHSSVGGLTGSPKDAVSLSLRRGQLPVPARAAAALPSALMRLRAGRGACRPSAPLPGSCWPWTLPRAPLSRTFVRAAALTLKGVPHLYPVRGIPSVPQPDHTPPAHPARPPLRTLPCTLEGPTLPEGLWPQAEPDRNLACSFPASPLKR